MGIFTYSPDELLGTVESVDIEDSREESPSESEQKKKDSRIHYCNAEISHEAIEEFLQTTMKKLKKMYDKLESK